MKGKGRKKKSDMNEIKKCPNKGQVLTPIFFYFK